MSNQYPIMNLFIEHETMVSNSGYLVMDRFKLTWTSKINGVERTFINLLLPYDNQSFPEPKEIEQARREAMRYFEGVRNENKNA